MIDAAIVGLGWWGRKLTHVAKASEHIRITLGVTPRPHALGDFGADCGFPVSDDYARALADPSVQAVILATPHAVHEEQIARAARAGKHVFCEKPLALTRASAERSVARCRDAGLVLGSGHERRFEPAMARLLDDVRAGRLGTVMQIEANFSHDRFADMAGENWRMDPAQAPAGGMTATGIHMFDLATAMLGEAEWAMANCATLATNIPTGDTVSALVRYRSGAGVHVSAMLATPFISRFAVYGREGWIEVRDKAHIEAPAGWQRLTCFAESVVETADLPPSDPVRDNLDAFARAVAGEADYPITGEELIANAAVMEAVFDSARTGRLTPVP